MGGLSGLANTLVRTLDFGFIFRRKGRRYVSGRNEGKEGVGIRNERMGYEGSVVLFETGGWVTRVLAGRRRREGLLLQENGGWKVI